MQAVKDNAKASGSKAAKADGKSHKRQRSSLGGSGQQPAKAIKTKPQQSAAASARTAALKGKKPAMSAKAQGKQRAK